MSVNDKVRTSEKVIAVLKRGKKSRTIKPSLWASTKERIRRLMR
jgi:hypothetical protein